MQPTPHDERTSVPVLDTACKVKLGVPSWAICPSWCSQWYAMRQNAGLADRHGQLGICRLMASFICGIM
jgi:hypothetical protein